MYFWLSEGQWIYDGINENDEPKGQTTQNVTELVYVTQVCHCVAVAWHVA